MVEERIYIKTRSGEDTGDTDTAVVFLARVRVVRFLEHFMVSSLDSGGFCTSSQISSVVSPFEESQSSLSVQGEVKMIRLKRQGIIKFLNGTMCGRMSYGSGNCEDRRSK